MIGSFSFGMSRLVQNSARLSGWFYLLEHNLGRWKYLRVSKNRKPNTNANASGGTNFPSSEEHLKIRGSSKLPDVCLRPPNPIKPAVRYPYKPISDTDSSEKLLNSSLSTIADSEGQTQMSFVSLFDLTSSPSTAAFRRKPHQTQSVGTDSPSPADSTLDENDLRESIARDTDDSSSVWSSCHSELKSASLNGCASLTRVERECWQIVAELNQQQCSLTRTSWTTTTFNTTAMCAENSVSQTLNSVTDDVAVHDLSCEKLLRAEYDFLSKMQAGVQCFSRPLRYCMLTPLEHSTLFQNGEKIMAIAEFHLKKLSDCDSIPDVYTPCLSLMTEAYTSYIRGLEAALNLLDSLQKESAFERFTEKATKGDNAVTITEFLEAPKIHLKKLTNIFQEIANCSSTVKDFNNNSVNHICEGKNYLTFTSFI